MKILQCHNYYQQPGGEDQVFADEAWLLRSRGHEVVAYTRRNDDIASMSRWSAARNTLWNPDSYRELRDLICHHRPDVMHCTNIFPLISPAAYRAARDENVPVVQSLHNYRMLCANALFLRDGRVCEDCLNKTIAWPAVVHGCYRDDRLATAAVAAMQLVHRTRNTWIDDVDRYIALSHFSRRKFIEGGLPAERINVKPNFVHPDPGAGRGGGRYAVFVGRLSREKGLETLISAWNQMPADLSLTLKIVGDGPLAEQVKTAAGENSRIEWLGHQARDVVLSLMGDALCTLLPSLCYENCPKTLIESYAKGTPVIASKLGALEEFVGHEFTGLHFRPADAADLAENVVRLASDAALRDEMRHAARSEYESHYTADANYHKLLDVYERAGCQESSASTKAKVSTVGEVSPCF